MTDPAALWMLAQVQAEIAKMREDRPRLAGNERTLARLDRKLAKEERHRDKLLTMLGMRLGDPLPDGVWLDELRARKLWPFPPVSHYHGKAAEARSRIGPGGKDLA